jgi:hypothetical protein
MISRTEFTLKSFQSGQRAQFGRPVPLVRCVTGIRVIVMSVADQLNLGPQLHDERLL